MTFEKIELDDTQPRKMIHKHQILSLQEYSIYKNVYPCFVFNFRSEDIGIERTYMQYIGDFMKMYHGLNKSSFNEIDFLKFSSNRFPTFFISHRLLSSLFCILQHESKLYLTYFP